MTVSSFPLKHWGRASKNWGRISFQLWLLHAHCITLTAKCWMNNSYRFCIPSFFLFLLYPLLCLCTVNSLLPCVSSDNELNFRCGVLQFGSLFFITWNPSTLRFHKKKINKIRQQQQQKQKHLNEGWSSQLYNFYSWEKKAWKKFRLVRDSNPWPVRHWCSALPIKVSSSLRHPPRVDRR